MKKTVFALLLLSSHCWAQPAKLFVSFSMPDSLIQAYAHKCARYHIPLVLRGLYHGSFRETIERIKALSQDAPGVAMLIDPPSFTAYGIDRVPTLVIGESSQFDKISGNVSIRAALNSFVDHGDLPELARHLLEEGNDE